MKKPRKKVKFHFLKPGKNINEIPGPCVCGGSTIIICEKLFKKMIK